MATVGHTLVGMALGTLAAGLEQAVGSAVRNAPLAGAGSAVRATPQGKAAAGQDDPNSEPGGAQSGCAAQPGASRCRLTLRAALWPGVFILCAHLVDIAEWLTGVTAPGKFDDHLFTHSPLKTAGLTLAVWLAAALLLGARRPLIFLLLAAAIFSHLLLDLPAARNGLLDLYDNPLWADRGIITQSIGAEVWLYGLVLLLTSLLVASMQRTCPPKGRWVAGALGAAAAGAAASRVMFLWIPVYGLAGLHALLLLRRWLSRRLLWSLAPLMPMLALVAVEANARWYYGAGYRYRHAGQLDAAIVEYQKVIALPTRMSWLSAHLELSLCYEQTGRLAEAERTLLEARRKRPDDYAPLYYLARFYTCPAVRNTPYDQPESARRLWEMLRDGPYSRRVRDLAEGHLR